MTNEQLKNKEKNLRRIKSQTIVKLEDLGFHSVPKPKRYKEMPEDITKLNDRELSRYFQHFVEWQGYAGDQLALARMSVMLTDYQVELSILIAMRGLSGGVTANKQEAQRAVAVRKSKIQARKAEALVYVLESQYSRFTEYSKLLSREQTRRSKEID